jgi:hypothetical protein
VLLRLRRELEDACIGLPCNCGVHIICLTKTSMSRFGATACDLRSQPHHHLSAVPELVSPCGSVQHSLTVWLYSHRQRRWPSHMEQNEWSIPLGHVLDPVPGTRLTLPMCPTAYHSTGVILTLLVPDWTCLAKLDTRILRGISDPRAGGCRKMSEAPTHWPDSALLLRPHPHAINPQEDRSSKDYWR